MKHSVIGMDIAKRVFQLHSVDPTTGEIERIKLRRDEVLPFFAQRSASLVAIRSVSEPLDDTVANGVPPTSLPKSTTTVAGELVLDVVSTVEPVPWVRAPGLVTEPVHCLLRRSVEVPS